MKINRVVIQNFKPFSKISLPLEGELPDGLFIVGGPNSSGKTSLVEAILWGLWGPRAIKWVSQEQLIRKTESYCRVTLDFEVEGAQYRINRKYTRGSRVTAVLFKRAHGTYVPVERNVTPIEERIDEILGISYQEALDTLFIRQGEVNRLAVATPAELRDLIRDLFGLERLEEISDVLKDEAKELDREIRSLEKELAILHGKEEQKKDLEKELEKLRRHLEELSEQMEELEEELGEIPSTLILKKLEELKSEIERLETDLQTRNEKLEQQEKERIESEESLNNVDGKLAWLEKEKVQVKEKKEELEKFNSEMEKKESLLQVEETRLEKSQHQLKEAQNRLREIQIAEYEIEEIKKKLQKKTPLETEKTALTERRSGLVEGFVTPENIKAQIESLKEEMARREKRISGLERSKEQLSFIQEEVEKLPEIEERWESKNKLYLDTRDTITEFGTELDNLERTMQSVEEHRGGKCPTCLQEVKPEYAENLTEKLREQITEGKAELARKRELLEELAGSAQELQKKRDKLKTSAAKIEGLKDDIQELQKQLEELEILKTKMETLANQLKKVKEISLKIGECDLKIKEIEEELLKLANLKGRMDELQKQVEKKTEIEEKIETFTSKEKLHSQECKKLKEELTELSEKFEKEKLQKVTEKLNKLEEEIKDSSKEKNQLTGSLTKIREQIRENQEKLHTLKEELETDHKELQETLGAVEVESIEDLLRAFERETMDEVVQDRTKKEIELAGKRENLKTIKDQVEEKDEKHAKMAEEIKELHEKAERLKRKKKRHTHAEELRILMDDFMSEHVVRNKLCGALKEATTQYLARFSTGRYSLLDIDAPTTGPYGAGVIITLRDHVDQLEKSRELLSGGDRASLGLALRMAISRLMSRIRPFKSTELKRPKVKCLIMDEPLGSLDSERRPEVVQTLIDDRAFTQIFLITHTNLMLDEEELANAHRIDVYQEDRTSKTTFQQAPL